MSAAIHDVASWYDAAQALGAVFDYHFGGGIYGSFGAVGDEHPYEIEVRDIGAGEPPYTTSTYKTMIKLRLPEDVPFSALRRRQPMIVRAIRRPGRSHADDGHFPVSDADWNREFKVRSADPDRFVLAGGREMARRLDELYLVPNWTIRNRWFKWSPSPIGGPWSATLDGRSIAELVSGTVEAVDRVRPETPKRSNYPWRDATAD